MLVSAQIELSEDYSFKIDKQYHAIAGTLITGTTFSLVYKKTNDIKFATRSSIFAGVGAGFLKEFYDGVSGKEIMISDFTYTSVSSIVTALIMQEITKYRQKKKRKKEFIEL